MSSRGNDSPASVRFGAFELFPRTGELRKNGTIVRLNPQPARVLLLLVRNAGQIVTRGDIQQSLWARETFVDFDTGLNRCIRHVRAALRDDADAPRYIETVPRIGYRFIAPVQFGDSLVEIASQKQQEQAPQQSRSRPETVVAEAVPARRRRWPILVGAATILVAIALSVFLLRPRAFVKRDFTLVPIASYAGSIYTPTFSPEGTRIAFEWDGPNQDAPDIYVKTTNSYDVLRLTKDTETDYSPVWSPDGGSIAFCRGSAGKGSGIWLMSALGGDERKICDLAAPPVRENRMLSWSPDGKWLAYSDLEPGATTGALYLFKVESGEKRKLTSPSQNEVDMYPAFAPDGRTLAFTRDVGRGVSFIYTLPFQKDGSPAGHETRFAPPGFTSVYSARPTWTPDSRSILFSSNQRGQLSLWLLAAQGDERPEILSAAGTDVKEATVSSSGKLAVVREIANVNIWKREVDGARAHPDPLPKKVVGTPRIQSYPRISPDGRRMAFESNVTGYTEIWLANSDGSDAFPLTAMRNPVSGSPSWSNDGSRVAFDSRSGGVPTVYVIQAQGGEPVAVTDHIHRSFLPSFSADDSLIYFTSDRSGRAEIWRVPVRGGAPEQITKQGGFAPLSSRDGRYLYYTAGEAQPLMLRRLTLATGEVSTIATGIVRRTYFPDAHDGIYFAIGNASARARLHFFTPRTGSHELFSFDKPLAEGFGLSPDGHYLYYSEIDYHGSELLLSEDFWHR